MSTLVDEIVEVSDYLKSSKGFSGWTLDNKQRLMFSAMLVGDSYSDKGSLMGSSAINSTVAKTKAEGMYTENRGFLRIRCGER